MSHTSALVAGFTLSLSLIMAIGVQNAFVLKQGLLKQHVFWLVLICASSDMILIGLGVAGFATLVNQFPPIEIISRYGGAIFLTIYGIINLTSAVRRSHSLNPDEAPSISRKRIIFTCLALTWLNPHVYLDTVFLIGSISTQYPNQKLAFFIGATGASYVFFTTLGYGARYLRRFFQSTTTWKLLDASIGFLMLFIACSLII